MRGRRLRIALRRAQPAPEELESKNGGRGFRAEYNYIAVTVLYLSRRELYRMTPGLFLDMVHTYTVRHRRSRSSEPEEE